MDTKAEGDVSMRFDPEATLHCWAIDVAIGGNMYSIPGRPASDWLLAISTGNLADVVPGMLADPAVLDDRILAGELSDELTAAARAAIAAAAGTTWWAAVRLVHGVAGTWVGGEFTLRGVDASVLSLAAYLAAVYRLITRDMDDMKRGPLDMELEAPPAGVAPEEWWDEDAAAAGFEAAMQAEASG